MINISEIYILTLWPLGGGTFVIGQEQDSDGSYNSAESFVGQITHLNIWDRELTFTEIENMKVSCKKFEGNVIAWVDIQTGLHGALRPEPSNFCEGNEWLRTLEWLR